MINMERGARLRARTSTGGHRTDLPDMATWTWP
jgi:hypothetical protein